MANSKIKQILVGSTTYDIEDAGAAHLATNNTFTGTNLFKGGTTQFLTSSAGLNDPKTDVGAYGILCQTGGNVGTYYKDGKITNGTNTLTLPLKTGIVALTSDIDVTAAGDNTFTGTNTFETEFQSSLYRTIIDKNGVSVGSGPSSGILVSTTYNYNRINYTNLGTTYMYYFPSANGTLALTSDIPTIEANPAASGTATLTKLLVGSTVYNLPGGVSPSGGVTIVTTSGSGNAVTGASISGNTLTLTKGSTFLTAHQSLASCAKLSGGNTFSGVQKFNNKVNIISNDGLYVSGPTQVNTLSVTMGKILYPASETNVHEYKLPDIGGTIALTSDIPDMSNYVDLNSLQTITGEKQFRNAIFVAQPKSYNGYIAGNPTASSTTIYDNWHIDFKNKDNSHKGSINIPSVNGDLHTFALLEDIKIKSASLSGTTLTLTI